MPFPIGGPLELSL